MRLVSSHRIFLVVALLVNAAVAWCAAPFAAEQIVTEVVPTQRPAEELLPILLPLAGDDVSAQAYRGQLILRGPARRVAELKDVLQQVDRPLRNLRIQVRRASSVDTGGGSASVAVRNGSATAALREDSSRTRGNDTQQLTVMEGVAAWLSLDTEVPVLGIAPSGAVIPSYAPLGNGLELRPQLSGEQVRLEISQRVAGVEGADVRTQTIQSVLLLVPGVWTALGSADTGAVHSGGGSSLRIGSAGGGIDGRADARGKSRRDEQVRWEVMVEVLP